MIKPVIAMMYDFDKTLCTKDMQEYSFIPNLEMEASSFWEEVNKMKKDKKMDNILAYMYLMIDKSKANHKQAKRDNFMQLGKDIEFFEGVKEWFDRINLLGEDVGITIEHYIISSGLYEIIEGSIIAEYFKEIFACEFYYDENGVAVWPKTAVNYTTKTQFLYRINKGILDFSDDESLNKYIPEDERPVPFRNMIYIGDGMTDIPCMKLVKANGGHSIAVYQSNKKSKVDDLLRYGRVDFLALADYREGSELYVIVRDIILKMAMVDSLKKKTREQRKEITKSGLV